MTTTTAPLASAAIAVRQYRQILLLPVLLEMNRDGEGDPHASLPSQWREWIKTFEQRGWQRRESLPVANTQPGTIDEIGCEPTYEEVVYFHPFARDLLYGDGSKDQDERAMLRFSRSDIVGMTVTLDAKDVPHRKGDRSKADGCPWDFRFEVPRLEVYLFKPGIAILAVEIVWQATSDVKELWLADVLMLQSRVRELYPPFFVNDKPDDQSLPGNCPRRVAWLRATSDGNAERADEIPESDFHKGRQHFARQVEVGAEPPVASHWAYLLEPIKPFRKRDEHGPRFRQIIDDRLPGLTYVAVDDPRRISEGDFCRLAFCETSGSAPYPYSEDFIRHHAGQYTYDRFWRPTSDHDSSLDGDSLTLNTRYLCSGFQFIAVVSAGNCYFNTLIRDHVRRHYLRLGLIAHFQRAALLKFADEMSEAIKQLKGQSPRQELDNERFRSRIEHLQMTFLKFTSRAWFREVSNQLQGQELFRWWSDLLGNQRLFEEVNQMYQTMHSVLMEHEARSLSRGAVYIAAVGVVIALVAAIVGIAAAR